MERMLLPLTGCPEHSCRMPAEITARFVLPSTGGPIEHVTVRCVRRHHFTLPSARLSGH
jgi:hypothetical protein